MNIFTATMPVWVFAVVVLAFALLTGASFILLAKAEQEVEQRRSDAWDLKTVKMQCDNLNTENKGLHIDLVAKIAECEMWQGLYGELLDTYHNLQGDAHATVPLVEVQHVPMTIAEASVEKVAPVKRIRKKAETKQ